MKNVALGQSIDAFQIERCKHLARDDRIRYIGRVLSDFLNYPVAEQFTFLVPGAFSQMVGNILHKAGEDVLALWREGGIGIGRDNAINPQLFGNLAKLGNVVATLGEFE